MTMTSGSPSEPVGSGSDGLCPQCQVDQVGPDGYVVTRTDGTVLVTTCSAACLLDFAMLERTGEKFADLGEIDPERLAQGIAGLRAASP
jgi:hypothetical protein